MDKLISDLVKQQHGSINPAALLAFIEVETGGKGFNPVTGKIIIQFEPAHFRKREPYAPSGLWSLNKVDVQAAEWKAFNDAFAIDPNSAMESTSIGLGQVMGYHWERLGYASVGAMWDDAKKGLDRQIYQIVKFIETDKRLLKAINVRDWHMVASIYNGAKYKELAQRIGRDPYDISLSKAFAKYEKVA
jgi:hypothetical protein